MRVTDTTSLQSAINEAAAEPSSTKPKYASLQQARAAAQSTDQVVVDAEKACGKRWQPV